MQKKIRTLPVIFLMVALVAAACSSTLAALPTLLVYIFLGRYFLRGLMAGSLKG